MKIRKLVRGAVNLVSEAEIPSGVTVGEAFVGARRWVEKKLEFIEGQNRRLFFATSTYIGDHTLITWITTGQRIFVDSRDLGIGQHLMFKGFWERTTTDVLKTLLPNDGVLVDLGAHYGYHTLTAAHYSKGSRVVAVEANPRLFGLLEKSVRVNQLRGRVTLHHCAVSDETGGTLTFVTPEDDPALGHILSPTEKDDGSARADVPVRTVDSVCAGLERIDVMKIDVEGHEWQVLQGARETIAKHDIALVVEYAPAHIERQHSTDEFHESLRELGLTHVYETPGGRLANARYEDLAANRTLRNIVLSKRALR